MGAKTNPKEATREPNGVPEGERKGATGNQKGVNLKRRGAKTRHMAFGGTGPKSYDYQTMALNTTYDIGGSSTALSRCDVSQFCVVDTNFHLFSIEFLFILKIWAPSKALVSQISYTIIINHYNMMSYDNHLFFCSSS